MARELGRSIPNPDDFLQSRFEDSDREHNRQQAEFIAKQMLAGQPDTVDQSAVHAIIAEWARGAGHRMRL